RRPRPTYRPSVDVLEDRRLPASVMGDPVTFVRHPAPSDGVEVGHFLGYTHQGDHGRALPWISRQRAAFFPSPFGAGDMRPVEGQEKEYRGGTTAPTPGSGAARPTHSGTGPTPSCLPASPASTGSTARAATTPCCAGPATTAGT